MRRWAHHAFSQTGFVRGGAPRSSLLLYPRHSSSSSDPPPSGAKAPTTDEALQALDIIRKHLEASPGFVVQLSQYLSVEVKRKLGLSWILHGLQEEFHKADVDKSGSISYREFHRWTKSILVTDAHVEAPPTKTQLRQVFARQIPPFIGFGVTDNGLMILSGDFIDSTFGMWLGISTMAAAALGNAFSNCIGMSIHGFIENTANKLGLPDPHLTLHQNNCEAVRKARTLGSMFGITVGCLLGMLPLLFMDPEAKQTLKYGLKTDEEKNPSQVKDSINTSRPRGGEDEK